ncbi:MAG: periplasmic heavy metal sensor [Hyphomicrobiales bacterium]
MNDKIGKQTKSSKTTAPRKKTMAGKSTRSRKTAKASASSTAPADDETITTDNGGGNGGNGGNGAKTSPQTTSGGSGRWLKIGLVLSLMLNALFIGAIGMRMYHVKQHGGWHHARFSPNVRMFLRELPRERRKELRQKFRKLHREMRSSRRDTSQTMRDMFEALSAENYDREKIASAFASLRQARDANATQHEKFFLAMIDNLTPEERKIMVAAMERRMKRHAERRKKFMERRKSQRE